MSIAKIGLASAEPTLDDFRDIGERLKEAFSKIGFVVTKLGCSSPSQEFGSQHMEFAVPSWMCVPKLRLWFPSLDVRPETSFFMNKTHRCWSSIVNVGP